MGLYPHQRTGKDNASSLINQTDNALQQEDREMHIGKKHPFPFYYIQILKRVTTGQAGIKDHRIQAHRAPG